MSLVIVDIPVPLRTDVGGVVRVGNTRVTLDTVIGAFKEGATAEEIVSQSPGLLLADVYAVIGYYLQRQPEVEAYLEQRQQVAREIRRQNEARLNQQGIRERLMTRQVKSGIGNNATEAEDDNPCSRSKRGNGPAAG